MDALLCMCIKEEQCSEIRVLWSEGVSGTAIHQRLSVQYGNSVLPQRRVYEWIEKLKNGCTNVTHHKGARRANCRLHPVSKHLTVPSTVHCCAPFLIMFQYWVLSPKTLWASVFLRMVGISTFSCRAIVDVSIPYSDIYSQAHNDGLMFCHQWWFCLRRCLVRYHSDPNIFGRCPWALLMHLWALFWDPSCIDFMKPKFVEHHFVGRTMANLQNMCHFINNHSSF